MTELACRVLDVVVASAMLIVLLPLFAVVAVLIRLDSRGRVIYRQQRVGRDLVPFTVNKFRTMRSDSDHETHRRFVLGLITGDGAGDTDGPAPQRMFKLTEDERVTRIGNLLRRSSVDELPQLWNVVLGDMSLVGPRSPIPYEVDHYPPHWFARFAVKPGVTGLWQVSGRSELTLEQMIELDTAYVRDRSLGLNLRILLRTIPAVLCARGAA